MRKRIKTLGILALFLMTLFLPGTGALAAEEEATWTTVASMSTARMCFQAEVIDGKIYAIGGYNGSKYLDTLEVYDPSGNSWKSLAQMTLARAEFQTEIIDEKIYVIGGNRSLNNCTSLTEVYDPTLNTWTTLASMSTKRTQFATAVVDGKIYAFGGVADASTFLSSAEVYDPLTNKWTNIASMPTVRCNSQTEVINGKIYVIGGSGGLYSADVYDPSSNTWTTLASMSSQRQYFQTEVVDGKIYAMGGNGTATVEVYDPSLNTWTKLASMNSQRQNFQTVVINEKIYAIGGTMRATAEMYDPSTGTWTNLPTMSTERGYFCCLVIDQSIYAVGGEVKSGSGSYLSSVEKYTVTKTLNSPTLSATAGDSQVDLNWTAVDDAVSYHVYRSTTSGGPYTQIATGVTDTSYTDTDVTNGTTYYYVVTAVDSSDNESDYSNEASATPEAVGNALLRITMTTGQEKEYDVSMTQANAFVSWYGSGTDNAIYSMERTYNVGTLSSRMDYLVHSKIAYFEVMAYDTDTTITAEEETKTDLISVTMSTGDVIEFETTADELTSFTTWYSAGGASSPTFAVDQDYNLGPFSSRTVYVVFDEIADFEIMEY